MIFYVNELCGEQFLEAQNLNLSFKFIKIESYLLSLKPGSHIFVIFASTLIMILEAIYNSHILFMTTFSEK